MSLNNSPCKNDSLSDRIHLIQQQYQNDEYDKKYIFFKQQKDYLNGNKSKTFRYLTPGVSDKKVPNNGIETAKYNIITFLPKNLYIQFSKLAHIYFIIIGICQTFKTISTTDGKPAIFLTFSIITMVSMIKDIVEDRQRHLADKKENESYTQRYNPEKKEFEKVFWKQLLIGDIVKINEEEPFPADLVILQTSLVNGDCYLETKNLDGETNLKRKVGFSPQTLQNMQITDQELLQYQLKYEQPNQQMYFFNGIMTNNTNNQSYHLNINNVCLRGSSLKATDHIYGMVIYTGHQTKIQLNSQRARYKFSRIELQMNKMIIWIFILLLAICLFTSSYYQLWIQDKKNELSYLQINFDKFDGHNVTTFFLFIPLWILLLGHFVPISLVVTVELVKYLQGQILKRDRNYKNINDDEFVDVKSSNLIEELGRVKYIFTDKTGTLTINQMNFKSISLNGTIYEKKDESIHENTILKSQELDIVLTQSTKSYVKELEGMMCLNLCHTLIIEKKENRLVFNGISPDEESIMNFCYNQGIYFSNEDINNVMSITFNQVNTILKFEKISVLEFDFERKRMSVIIKDLQTNEYKLYCKGADINIFKICDESQKDKIKTTSDHLHYFAVKGLRTLAFGYKILKQQQVDQYLNQLSQIKQDIYDQEIKIQKLNIEMETNLILLGGTGINDRLQDDVQYTLKNLKTAGIKVWMLTGDKIETAQNIAIQCNLITFETDLLILDQEQFNDKMESQIEQFFNKIGKSEYSVMITGYSLYAIDNHFRSSTTQMIKEEQQKKYMSINNLSTKQKFHQVLQNSATVIACKVTPKQKAELVNLIKVQNPLDTTLAIGDGANDVSMITCAHVGIGIRGKEILLMINLQLCFKYDYLLVLFWCYLRNFRLYDQQGNTSISYLNLLIFKLKGRQAAKISDFSIGEFRHLNRLILYQGLETYRKNTELVFFNFYKNQIGFLVYFWYNFFAGQCGTYFYDQWVKQLYNLIFTSLPIILYCQFDELFPAHEFCTIFQHIPNKLEKMPLFYKRNLENPTFTTFNFWKEFFKGSVQSCIITFIALMCLNDHSDRKAHQSSHIDVGMLVFTFAVIIPNLKVFQLHKTHYPFTIFFIFGGIAIYFISLIIASKIKALDSFGTTHSVLGVGGTYLGILIMLIIIHGFQKAINDWCQFMQMSQHYDYDEVIEKEESVKNDQKSIPQSSNQNMIEIVSNNKNNIYLIDEINYKSN